MLNFSHQIICDMCIYVILINHNFRREDTETEIMTSEFSHFSFIQEPCPAPLIRKRVTYQKAKDL